MLALTHIIQVLALTKLGMRPVMVGFVLELSISKLK